MIDININPMKIACSGKDCPLRMRCSLYDNFIYHAMKCIEDVEYVDPDYNEDMDYCEYFQIEEA